MSAGAGKLAVIECILLVANHCKVVFDCSEPFCLRTE